MQASWRPDTPMNARDIPRLAILALACGVLGACASDGREADGPRDRPLEVPPDLVAPQDDSEYEIPEAQRDRSATYSQYRGEGADGQGSRTDVLADVSTVRVARHGDNRWLVVEASPGGVWESMKAFLEERGFGIAQAEPEAGIIQTEWKGNPEDLREAGLGTLFSHILPSQDVPTRDKFHVRLERGEQAGTTEVYVAHHGVKQVASGDTTVWEPRPSDPSLEAELLARFLAYLDRDVDEEEARQRVAETPSAPAHVRLAQTEDGRPVLELRDGFARAWRVLGLALDRRGFDVADRNRTEGVYYLRYRDPEAETGGGGFFSWLAFWRDRSEPEVPLYRVVVEQAGNGSRVTVEDADGEPAGEGTARRLLTVLEEELR